MAARSARNALTRLHIVFEIEHIATKDLPESLARPGWEEFRQRHFVDGEPVPVRGQPDEVDEPRGWQAMHEKLVSANNRFRAELVRLAEASFPGARVVVKHDRGPLRRSAGSIDRSEEKYGFEIYVDAKTGDLPAGEAVDRMKKALVDEGWQLVEADDSTLAVARDQYEIDIDIEPGSVFIAGRSPLFSASAAPGTTWIAESRL